MKLIEPNVELIQQQPGLIGIYKQIELAGRTCYKSEDKITENSAKEFVDRMIKSGHTAMLEHGTVYLTDINWDRSKLEKYKNNKYSRYNKQYLEKDEVEDGNDYDVSYKYAHYVTTNYRVLVENNWLDDLKYICEPTEYHERRITMKFTTNIGVTREGNRHRVNSIAEESTRYCNYTKDKFGNEITFTAPSWLSKEQLGHCDSKQILEQSNVLLETGNYKDNKEWAELIYLNAISIAEQHYLKLIELGWTPQQAREVLPLATKSDVVYTAFAHQWRHWFDLRLFGTTGKPHPNMKEISKLAMDLLIENDLWYLIYKPQEAQFNPYENKFI